MKLTALIVRCVACQHEWDAKDARDVPMCPKCFSPGVSVEATAEVLPVDEQEQT